MEHLHRPFRYGPEKRGADRGRYSPGRLISLIERRAINLEHSAPYVVLDEAG